MPSASKEVADWAIAKFGGLDDHAVMAFLKQEGFELTPNWTWKKAGVSYETMSEDQYLAIVFLVQEWDFGGFES